MEDVLIKNALYSDESYRLAVLLGRTRDALTKARRNELSPLGISPMAASALSIIQAIGRPVRTAELSRWLFREHHSVLGLIERMQRKGLVTRNEGVKEGVVLTEKGRQVCKVSAQREVIHRVFASLSKEQHRQLRSCLEILWDAAAKELGSQSRPPFP